VILGTAGHVDHGKTALVQALTGVDTDRLAEEKRRGITIELGFAPLALPGDMRVGVVDVPGHEAFVRTMLAGASGIDLALLVVAADEGVMPQTREHLEILRLLGISGAVVALTKSDLVDDEWAQLVEEEVRALLDGSRFSGAAIVRTSAHTGAGLDELRIAIAEAAGHIRSRDANDLFRMPVDRAFTIRGTGTVVTGTVWSGTLQSDDMVSVLPSGRSARVRGIESHGASQTQAVPGSRAAVALASLALDEVQRGAVLVAGTGWRTSRTLLVNVALLENAPATLGPRHRVRFHLGTADVEARVVCRGGGLAPGEQRQARIVLGEPMAVRAGDPFVLRSGSPVATIGGGIVNDPLPGRPRPQPWPRAAALPAERLQLLLELEGPAGLDPDSLPIRLGAPPAQCSALVEGRGDALVRTAGRLFQREHLDRVKASILDMVGEYHERLPLEPGIPTQLVRSRLGAAAEIGEMAIRELQARGDLASAGPLLFRPGWRPAPAPHQERLVSQLSEAMRVAGREPPAVAELTAIHGPDVPGLLRYLERGGTLIQVETDRYYDRAHIEEMIAVVERVLSSGGTASPATLREALGLSRKFLIPFLEYCDRIGLTERRGEGRVSRNLPSA
jgi:selenocysteine-specific elongation factor